MYMNCCLKKRRILFFIKKRYSYLSQQLNFTRIVLNSELFEALLEKQVTSRWRERETNW